METIVKDLGKLVITVEQYDADKEYEFPAVVEDEQENTYITKKNVPIGILLTDKEYWLPLGNSGGGGGGIPDNSITLAKLHESVFATDEDIDNIIEE